jgi:capsular polysaccharide biosynthesis protein
MEFRNTAAAGPTFSRIFKLGWWLIALCTLLGLGAGAAYAATQSAQYSSKADILVKPVVRDPLQNSGSGATSISLDTESQLVLSDPVLVAASKNIKGNPSVDSLRSDLTVTAVAGSTVMEVSCVQTGPSLAADCADAVGRAYLANRADTANQLNAAQLAVLKPQLAQAQANLATILKAEQAVANDTAQRLILDAQRQQTTASVNTLQSDVNDAERFSADPGTVLREPAPGKRSSTSKLLIVFAGGVIGLVLGLILAALRAQLDKSIRNARDVEGVIDAPVLAVIPTDGTAEPATVVAPQSQRGKAYYQLTNGVLGTAERIDRSAPKHAHVVGVVAAGAGAAGTSSTVAVNLAHLIAGRGRSVSVMTADTSGAASLIAQLPESSQIKVIDAARNSSIETIVGLEIESGRTVVMDLGPAEDPAVQAKASAAEVVVLATVSKGIRKPELAEIRDGLAAAGIRSLVAVLFKNTVPAAVRAERVGHRVGAVD